MFNLHPPPGDKKKEGLEIPGFLRMFIRCFICFLSCSVLQPKTRPGGCAGAVCCRVEPARLDGYFSRVLPCATVLRAAVAVNCRSAKPVRYLNEAVNRLTPRWRRRHASRSSTGTLPLTSGSRRPSPRWPLRAPQIAQQPVCASVLARAATARP